MKSILVPLLGGLISVSSLAAESAYFSTPIGALPKDEQKKALKEWLRTCHDWLIQSEPGKDEHRAKNNHGTFYDVQAVRIALVIGCIDPAKRILEEAKQRHIAVQIESDGKQPLELDRTTSFSIDFMLPYADVAPKLWELPQIIDKHESKFVPIFRLATLAYGGDAYEAVIAKYEDSLSKRF